MNLPNRTQLSVSGEAVTPYTFGRADSRGTAAWYLHPAIERLLPPLTTGLRVLDVGCGNGYWAGWFAGRGCAVVGLDPSPTGIEIARQTHPQARFEQEIVSRDVLSRLNTPAFDLVVSFEVVEHLYSPVAWAEGCYAACRPGGMFVCSTPYHGYLKNLLLAGLGKWERHLQPLNEGGHIKFWHVGSLTQLLKQAGFVDVCFAGAGRWPWLWKSMVLSARRPA